MPWETETDLRNIQHVIGEATILLTDERQILSKNAVMAKLQQLGETESDDRRVLLYWNARKVLGYIRASVTGSTLPADYARWSDAGNDDDR
ncbi:hypothetical protein [Pantoea sp. B65]|uniref:hypothetical protein n=1 Tax=Pantoea sp. B65 TaxID=2813359 RepID=UPI0039B41278